MQPFATLKINVCHLFLIKGFATSPLLLENELTAKVTIN